MKREPIIPVETPFDELEHMRALRCACSGELAWGERACEREADDRHVIDRFELACRSCGKKSRIAFRCDTGSDAYRLMSASTFGLAAALGPEAGVAAIAGSEGAGVLDAFASFLEGPAAAPPEPRRKRRRRDGGSRGGASRGAP